MLIGIETTPKIILHYFPNVKQAQKWQKKHPNFRIINTLSNQQPTKLDLETIWHGNHKLSKDECRLIWYERRMNGSS